MFRPSQARVGSFEDRENLVVQGRQEIVSQCPSTRLAREPERLYPGLGPPSINKANLC